MANQMLKSKRLKQLIDTMRSSNLRVTEPRIAILNVLLHNHGPFTAEEIHGRFKNGSCDLATIYRSLSSLEQGGLIHRCEFGDGSARFELSEIEKKDHHHHIICRSCRKIETLEDCALKEIDRLPKQKGFIDITHSLEFFGICQICSSSKKT